MSATIHTSFVAYTDRRRANLDRPNLLTLMANDWELTLKRSDDPEITIADILNFMRPFAVSK
jgi:hypothetical protein